MEDIFMPTRDQWVKARREADNVAAQLSVREQTIATLEKALAAVTAERDAARAEVARLTAALKEYGWHLDHCPAADCSTTRCECGYATADAAMRGDTAPATGRE